MEKQLDMVLLPRFMSKERKKQDFMKVMNLTMFFHDEESINERGKI